MEKRFISSKVIEILVKIGAGDTLPAEQSSAREIPLEFSDLHRLRQQSVLVLRPGILPR